MNVRTIALALIVTLVTPSFLFAREPNDLQYNKQWYLEQISAPEAWETSIGDDEVIVAVLDAGIDLDHPDLEGNLWKNESEIPKNGQDDDGNGYIDDVNGWDFVDNDNDPEPYLNENPDESTVSHGSLVSGLLGAEGDNKIGVTGVNWDVTIMPLRTLDDFGSGNSLNAIDAVQYAIDHGARVINLSFSGELNDPNLGEAIQNAYHQGIVVVAAVGNENKNTDFDPTFPACYGTETEDWVIGVGSTDQGDQKSSFSNYGSDCVDLSAPGEEIYGVGYHNPSEGFVQPYKGYWSGTSMAAPLVSGAAALLLATYPDLSPDEVETILKLSADPLFLAPQYSGKMGTGRLNVEKALEIAVEFSNSEEESTEEVPEEVSGGSLISTATTSAVYFVENGSRRAFIDEQTYFTHYDSFDTVQEVEDAELSGYTLGGLMLPKAGVVLVKIQSDPRVYALEENVSDPFSPILREIESEEIAQEMYGDQWADFVIDVEPTFFGHFSTGEPITSPEPVDTSIMKTRDELAQLAQ